MEGRAVLAATTVPVVATEAGPFPLTVPSPGARMIPGLLVVVVHVLVLPNGVRSPGGSR